MSASDGQDGNGNTDLILSGLTKIFSGTCKTAAGLGGVAVGSFASGVLVADNATGVLTFDDAALFVTVPFTAASGKYAFNGSREAVDGVTELTVGVGRATKAFGIWIGDKAKSAWDNIFGAKGDAKSKPQGKNAPRNEFIVYQNHNSMYYYTPAPNSLPGIPDAQPVKRKTPVQGGGGLRKRWKDADGNIYEWDSQHGDLEKYNKNGQHQGSIDAKTGERTKPPVKGRKIEP